MGKLGGKLHDEVAVDTLRMKLLNEVAGCFHSATCCQEIIVKKYDVIGSYSVFVDLNGVDAIFLRIALLDRIAWELARLTAKNDSCSKTDGNGGAS